MNSHHIFENNSQTPFSRQKKPIKTKSGISKKKLETTHIKSPETTNLKLSKQELLEVSLNISRYYAPKIISYDKKLVLLPIDSQYLYAYWNLVEDRPEQSDQPATETALILQVYHEHEKNNKIVKSKPIVEMAINSLQSGQKIKLPLTKRTSTYTANIGRITAKQGFVALIKSNRTHPLQEKVELGQTNKDQVSPTIQEETNFESASYDSAFSDISHYINTNLSGLGIRRLAQ